MLRRIQSGSTLGLPTGDIVDPVAESLMRDHLEAARFYLLGSMPAEYQLSLKLAERLLSDIKNHDLQGRIREFLESQRSRET